MRQTQSESFSTDDMLTATLVVRLMGWKVAPDRFIKPGGGWIPRWRFDPLSRLDAAFQLLDRATSDYRLEHTESGGFTVELQIGERTARAAGEEKARVITLAVARGIGLEV